MAKRKPATKLDPREVEVVAREINRLVSLPFCPDGRWQAWKPEARAAIRALDKVREKRDA